MSKKPAKLDGYSRANLSLAKPTTRVITLPAGQWAVRGVAGKVFRSRSEALAAAARFED